jgi:hypothetical protein
VAQPHCDSGNGGDWHGGTAPTSPVAPRAIVRRGFDKFVLCPILSVLLLLLLLHLINPLPREAVSDGRFRGQVRQAQQRCDVGLADGGGTHKDYDQWMVLMSLMRSLLLPWRMSGWLMTSVLCLDVVVVSIQQRCISHCGQPCTMLSHRQLVHRQRGAAVEAGRWGWGEEDGSGGGGSSVDEQRQQLQVHASLGARAYP